MKARLRTDQPGKKETVATAEGVWLVVAVGTVRPIGRVRRTGSVIAQASAGVRLDFALSGKSIEQPVGCRRSQDSRGSVLAAKEGNSRNRREL